MKISIVPRHDLSFLIEEEVFEPNSDTTVYSYITDSIKKSDISPAAVTVLLDGEYIPFERWRNTFLKNHSELKFVLEPEGETAYLVVIVLAMAASFVYSMIMMNRMKSNTGMDSSAESRSIYDVNAQGNKVKLGDVIPEQFGTFKKFPDYLSDPHTYYKDNEMYLDMILSQGVGSFLHSGDFTDVFLGATPVSSLTGVQCHVAEPGEDLSQNTIDPEITKCWFTSTEVTSSGHSLHCVSDTKSVITHLEYQSLWFENYDEQGATYQVGDIIQISGVKDEWVLIPAMQDVNDGYPALMATGARDRVNLKYECPFEHEHQYQMTPFTQDFRPSDGFSKTSDYLGGYDNPDLFIDDFSVTVNNSIIWSECEIASNDAASYWLSDCMIYVYTSECSLSADWSRFGNENGWATQSGYTIDYASATVASLGWNREINNDGCTKTGTYSRITGLNTYHPANRDSAYYSYLNESYLSSDHYEYGDGNQYLFTWDVKQYNTLYYGHAGLYGQIAVGSARQLASCLVGADKTDWFAESGSGIPFSRRLNKNNVYTVEMRKAVRLKCTKCDTRPELVGKYVDFVLTDSPTQAGKIADVYTGSMYNVIFNRGSYSQFYSSNAQASHFVFRVPLKGETIPTDQGGSDYNKLFMGTHFAWSGLRKREYRLSVADAARWCYDPGGTAFSDATSFVVDQDDGIVMTATRVTAKAADCCPWYDADSGIVDDNGYYKIVYIYGGDSDARNEHSHSTSDLDKIQPRSAPFGAEVISGYDYIYGSNYTPSGAKKSAPNVRKFQVVRCDAAGNEISGWDGFWNCLSQSKQITVRNLTKNLSTTDTLIAGPYRASPIGAETDEVEVDITAPRGIYYMNSKGGTEKYEVTCRIEYQRKGDSSWQSRDVTLSSAGVKRIISYNPPEYTSSGTDAVGITEKFSLTKGDWYFRVYRITEEHNTGEDDDNNYVDDVKWTGLKSVIANPQQYTDMTTLLMRFRGNETLSELSDNQISTLWTRKLPDIETGELKATQALAPAVKYICDNSKFRDLLNIDNLQDMNDQWAVRGLLLNGTLDSDNTLLQVLQDILHIGYSELSTRADMIKIVQVAEHTRTQIRTCDATKSQVDSSSNLKYAVSDISYLFTPANYTSISIDISLPKRDDAEEVAVDYTDIETYKTATVYLHLDTSNSTYYGQLVITDYPTSIYQEKLHTFGVTDREQAIAMGARRLRTLKRQRVKISLKTELEGLNVNYKDLVGIAVDEVYWQMFSSEQMNRVQRDSRAKDAGSNPDRDMMQVDNTAHNAYSGRMISAVQTNDRYLCKIYPPVSDLQYESYSNVMPTAFFVTDVEGTPHYMQIQSWTSSNDEFRVDTLPFEWDEEYGASLEYPRISSCNIVPCWVESVKPTDKDCTIELVNYDPAIFRDDLLPREGYGVSSYGNSSYGESY